MRNTKVAYSTDIDVDVVTNFIAQQSIEADQQFVFSYTITAVSYTHLTLPTTPYV